MRIALSKLEYITKKVNNTWHLVPFFLHYNDEKKIEVIYNFLEQNRGRRRKEIDFKMLSDLFPSEKVSEALVSTFQRYFSFQQRPFTLELKGIDTVEKLRQFVFDFVSTTFSGGFITDENRSLFLQKIEKSGINANLLDNLLYSDREQEKILTKTIDKKINLKKVIEEYNYDILETVLNYSLKVEFHLSQLPGFLSKKIIAVSKMNYVWSEIEKTNNTEFLYTVKIEPPTELFEGATTWGKNITQVALFIVRSCFRESFRFKLLSEIQPRKKQLLFIFESEDNHPFPFKNLTKSGEKELELKNEIDSEIERIFLSQWQNNKGWYATAEPETIFLNDKLFIPDFVLKRGRKKVYLEIVGYYTEKYIHKKKKKMEEIAKTELPIIYLIDKKLESHFKDLNNIDIVYYKKNKVPDLSLHSILEKKYSDVNERLNEIIVKFSKICEKTSRNNDIVETSVLARELDLYTSKNVKKFLKRERVKKELEKYNLISIPDYGLITLSKFNEVKKTLEEKRKTNLNELVKLFPELEKGLVLICSFLGCDINYSSLVDIEIIYISSKERK